MSQASGSLAAASTRLNASIIFVAAGALGSVGFMLRAGQHTPRLLLAGFILWVLSPFAALFWAIRASARSSSGTRAALQGVTLFITLASLASYSGLVNIRPPRSGAAFAFVAVPPASWILLGLVVSVAALLSRRRH